MSNKNLIIQTLRLGDLVMSFPLCSWLKQNDGRAIWIVGEEKFYKELFRVSPENVCYVPLEAKEELLKENFHQIINLSHRPEAAILASELNASNYIGAVETDDIKKIHGIWQLYRTSLTHNNHYNKFHWADLNALDSIPLENIQQHTWKKHQPLNKGRIGLFVGASETVKRPDTIFWAELATGLAKKGYQPVFLGGPSPEEQEIATEAARLAQMPRGSLAGRFSIFELIVFLQSLDLLITPDTGPMHLAALEGIPTFNLSIGPVHPWETAPYPPNHYVLRSTVSCSGCWQCTKETQLCKKAFIPARIANLVHSHLQNKTLPILPELALYKTGRTSKGLYQLENIFNTKTYHNIQGDFWRYFFANYFFQLQGKELFLEDKLQSIENLFTSLPKMQKFLKTTHLSLIKEILCINKKNKTLDHEAWKAYPPFSRPLTSFMQLLLENDNYSSHAKESVLHLLEDFGKTF